jgi:hypothetical protein
MILVKLSDLIGKNIEGLKADIRSRNADGSLQYPDDENHKRGPIIVTMKSVKIEQRGFTCGTKSQRAGQEGLFPWIYWYFEGHSCNYGGTRIDNGEMPEDFIEIEEGAR